MNVLRNIPQNVFGGTGMQSSGAGANGGGMGRKNASEDGKVKRAATPSPGGKTPRGGAGSVGTPEARPRTPGMHTPASGSRKPRPQSARSTPGSASPHPSWGRPTTPASNDRPRSGRTGPTVPKPFALASDRRLRGSTADDKECTFKPEVHPVPTKTLREYKPPKKPSPKHSTEAKPFNLLGTSKFEASAMKIAMMAAAKEQEELEAIQKAQFRASPKPEYGPTFQPSKSPQELTKAEAPKFVVDERLQKRREYDEAIAERNWIKEMETAEAEARQKAEEEAEMREMRKTMYVEAHKVPEWYYEERGPLELRKVPTAKGKPQFKA